MIENEETPWSKLAVIICEKCQTLFTADHLEIGHPLEKREVSEALKKELKSRLKADGLSEKCRVMTSSCQDICKDNRQAVTLLTTDGTTKTFVINPFKNKEELYALMKKTLG